MDVRKTGWSVAVEFTGRDGERKRTGMNTTTKAIAKRTYKECEASHLALKVELFRNGKLVLRSVKDCGGRMVQAVENG